MKNDDSFNISRAEAFSAAILFAGFQSCGGTLPPVKDVLTRFVLNVFLLILGLSVGHGVDVAVRGKENKYVRALTVVAAELVWAVIVFWVACDRQLLFFG